MIHRILFLSSLLAIGLGCDSCPCEGDNTPPPPTIDCSEFDPGPACNDQCNRTVTGAAYCKGSNCCKTTGGGIDECGGECVTNLGSGCGCAIGTGGDLGGEPGTVLPGFPTGGADYDVGPFGIPIGLNPEGACGSVGGIPNLNDHYGITLPDGALDCNTTTAHDPLNLMIMLEGGELIIGYSYGAGLTAATVNAMPNIVCKYQHTSGVKVQMTLDPKPSSYAN